MHSFRGWTIGPDPNKQIPTNPDCIQIAKAVEEAKKGKLQDLVFNSLQFQAEFAKHKSDFYACYAWIIDYHAGRVAYFVVKGWANSPIEITASGAMNEGQHRLLAACFMKLDEIEVIVI